MFVWRDKFARFARNRLLKAFAPVMIGGVSFIVIRHYVVVGSVKDTRDKAKGKTVVITGASTGIGKEMALKFVKKGARVILACHDEEKCKLVRRELIYGSRNKEISVRRLDLSSLESIRKFAAGVVEREACVDVLVNNGAVMMDTHAKVKEVTSDGFEMQMGVNYLGHFLLTNLLLDKMSSTSTQPQVINITCAAMKKGKLNFDDFNYDSGVFSSRQAYRDSKLALWLFTQELSARLASTKMRVNAVNPGGTLSRLDRNMTYHKSYISSLFMSPVRKVILKTPQQAAVIAVNLAIDSDYKDVSGALMTPHGKLERGDGGVETEMVAKKLWLLSEKWTRIK